MLPVDYLTRPDPSKTIVYVSTIQRMARNLFGAEAGFAWEANDVDHEEGADKLDIPIHAFDLSTEFQKVLEDYPRAKIPFLVATRVVDEVSSHAIER